MKPEEANKIAEAIKRAQLNELTSVDEIVKILTTDPAAPVEKEYRAGEWVPKEDAIYWCVLAYGGIVVAPWLSGIKACKYRLSQGNVFPSEAIAEAAKKHAEFWRAFDMADEGGRVGIWAWVHRSLLTIGPTDSIDSSPRWKSEESARAWVDSHGGEAYVSEMLTKGRVFRFKWGGE